MPEVIKRLFLRYRGPHSGAGWGFLILGLIWKVIDDLSNVEFLWTHVNDVRTRLEPVGGFIAAHDGSLQWMLILWGFAWLLWVGRKNGQLPTPANREGQLVKTEEEDDEFRPHVAVLAEPEWLSTQRVVNRRQMILELERRGYGPEPARVTCLVQDPRGNPLIGNKPSKTLKSGLSTPPKVVYSFDYPKDFSGVVVSLLVPGRYRVIWEGRPEVTALPIRLVDEWVTPPIAGPPSLELFRNPEKAPFFEPMAMKDPEKGNFQRLWLRVGIRNTTSNEMKRIRVVLESFEPRTIPLPIEHDLWPMDRPLETREISLMAGGIAYVNVAFEESPSGYGDFSFCYAQGIAGTLPTLDAPYELVLRTECDVAPPERWKLLMGGRQTWRLDSLELL